MKQSLLFLSVVTPMTLLVFGAKVANTPFFMVGSVILMLAEVCYGYRQFHAIGDNYNIDLSDAFWLSACVSAVATLLFLGIQVWYGWRCIAGFDDIPYAYVPFAAAFSYCCLLGTTICIIRLKMNRWIGKTSKAQTWCFLIMALSLIACVVYAIGNKYFEIALPEAFLNANYAILWLCCIGIAACGYRLTILKKD